MTNTKNTNAINFTRNQLRSVEKAVDLVESAQNAHETFGDNFNNASLRMMVYPGNISKISAQTKRELLTVFTTVSEESGNSIDQFLNQLAIKLQMIVTSARRDYNKALAGKEVSFGLDLHANKFVHKHQTTNASKATTRKAHTKQSKTVELNDQGYQANNHPTNTNKYDLLRVVQKGLTKASNGKQYFQFGLIVRPFGAPKSTKTQYRSVLVSPAKQARLAKFNHLTTWLNDYQDQHCLSIIEQRSIDNKFMNVIDVFENNFPNYNNGANNYDAQ